MENIPSAVELTDEMLEAGERILDASGIVYYEICPGAEYPLLTKIFTAMCSKRKPCQQIPAQGAS